MAQVRACARPARTTHALTRTPSPCQGKAEGPTHRTPSSPGHRPIPCGGHDCGYLSTAGRLDKRALYVAESLRRSPGCLGPSTPAKTPEPSDANASTCRRSRRGLAPAVAPQRHRRWRHRHAAGARPPREGARALTTHPLPSCTPPSHGGARTQGWRLHGFCPGGRGFPLRPPLATRTVCGPAPESDPSREHV